MMGRNLDREIKKRSSKTKDHAIQNANSGDTNLELAWVCRRVRPEGQFGIITPTIRCPNNWSPTDRTLRTEPILSNNYMIYTRHFKRIL